MVNSTGKSNSHLEEHNKVDKRPNNVWFHLYKMLRKSKSTYRENRLMADEVKNRNKKWLQMGIWNLCGDRRIWKLDCVGSYTTL